MTDDDDVGIGVADGNDCATDLPNLPAKRGNSLSRYVPRADKALPLQDDDHVSYVHADDAISIP